MRKRILVVEDDYDIRETMAELLSETGYDVRTAENGEVALQVLRDSGPAPQLIILDLRMPVMDGYAFRRQQERDSRFGTIPVVLMSANEHIAEERLRTGAKDYVKKPVDVKRLQTVVARWVG